MIYNMKHDIKWIHLAYDGIYAWHMMVRIYADYEFPTMYAAPVRMCRIR